MENKYSTSGIAEDLIRSFVQMACAEIHAKTLLENRISELENGLIEESETQQAVEDIENIQNELIQYADMRRQQMLLLYKMYGEKGDRKQWCMIKHLGIAMNTMFECWQASDNDEEMLRMSLEINAMFIQAVSKFIGTEITSCSACFTDMLKGALHETDNMQ